MQDHLQAERTEVRFDRARRGCAAVPSYQFLRVIAVHVVNLQPVVLTQVESVDGNNIDHARRQSPQFEHNANRALRDVIATHP